MSLVMGFTGAQSPPPPTSTTNASGISQLEGYKGRLAELEKQTTDRRRAAQMRQMQHLLSLMQRSLADNQAQTPPPITAPKTPGAREPKPTHPANPTTLTDDAEAPVEPSNETPETTGDPAIPSTPPSPLRGKNDPLPNSIPQSSAKNPAPASPITPLAERTEAQPLQRPELPRWFFQAQVTTAVGYQENLLRSAFTNLESALLYGELDLQLLNTRREDYRLLTLGRYTRTHFLDEPDVRDEDLLFLLGEAEYRVSDSWWLGLNASFFSAHQPFDDPDVIDLNGASLPLRFRQLTLAPQLSWEPQGGHRWTWQSGFRQEETDGLQLESQDNDQWFLSLDYTYEPDDRHRFRFDYHYTLFDYDERSARVPSGLRLDDPLELSRHDWSVAYRRTWNATPHRWRAESRLRLILDDDERGGYDDLARLEVRGRASLRLHKRTEINADLRYGHYFYDRRHVRLDDPSRRERSYWAGGLSLEHRFSKRTALRFHYDFRENAGNKSVDRYGAHTLYTGIRITF